MANVTRPERATTRRGDARRLAIQRAALEEFAQRGIAATSMAGIAKAAGVSRPALYQYFTDKADIFASAFVGLFEELVDGALDELHGHAGSDGIDAEPKVADGVSARLDGFLQRYEGDLWQRMAASRYTDEIVEAKDERVAMAVTEVVGRLWSGVDDYLRTVAPGRSREAVARRADWLELLRLSPKGFRFDQPPVDIYRRRLTALANTVAADIESV